MYTLRKKRKKVGKDWVKREWHGKKVADVYVEEVGKASLSTLVKHLNKSGFSSVDEWVHEYKVLSRANLDEAYLYRVVLLDDRQLRS